MGVTKGGSGLASRSTLGIMISDELLCFEPRTFNHKCLLFRLKRKNMDEKSRISIEQDKTRSIDFQLTEIAIRNCHPSSLSFRE